MNPAIKDTMEAIISRFPVGSHALKIRHMLEETVPFDYDEVRRGLEQIRESGGSEGLYVTDSDKEDCAFYITELEEAKNMYARGS